MIIDFGIGCICKLLRELIWLRVSISMSCAHIRITSLSILMKKTVNDYKRHSKVGVALLA